MNFTVFEAKRFGDDDKEGYWDGGGGNRGVVGIKNAILGRKNVWRRSKSISSQDANVSRILNENYLNDSSEIYKNPRKMKGPPSSTSFFLVSEDVFTKWQRITSDIFLRW